MKNIINSVKKILQGNKKSYLSYDIDSDNDIDVEIAKKMIIESISITEITEKCKQDGLCKDQIKIVVNSLMYIISEMKDIY